MKAILVINKSESCTGCLLGIYNKKWFCLATNKDIDITDRYSIPESCPLKPMPHKLQADWYTDGYKEGFNACLEEIEKDVREAEHD